MYNQLDLFGGHMSPNFTQKVNLEGGFNSLSSPPDAEVLGQPPNSVVPARALKTLADAREAYSDAVSEHPRRVKYRSAMTIFGKVVGLPLQQIPADAAALRALAKGALPMSVGLKPRRWGEVQSDVRCGLRALGADIIPARDDSELSSAWRVLVDQLPEDRFKIGLSKFTRFMSRTGVEPHQVTPTTLEAFHGELQTHGFGVEARRAANQTAKLFNRAGAALKAWPQVSLPTTADPRRYALHKSAFPPSLLQSMEAFLIAKANSDPLDDDYVRPVGARTTQNRRVSLNMMVSALALSGAVPASEITDLEVLTRIENVKAIFAWYRNRCGGTLNPTHHSLMWLLRTVAEHWLKEPIRTEKIKRLLANLSDEIGDTTGIRPKNRERLRQLKNPANRRKLYRLPHVVFREVEQVQEPGYAEAVRLMKALQVGILSFVPIRIKNLTELQVGINLVERGSGKNRQMWIFLPAKITKTKVDYNAPLPAQLYPLIDAWQNKYKPLVHPGASSYLFPNTAGQKRNPSGVSQEFRRFLQRETGLVMHPHLFRHLAAMIILMKDPGAIEYVRQLLGHKSTATTLKAYAEFQTEGAFHNLEFNILEIVEAMPDTKPKRGGR